MLGGLDEEQGCGCQGCLRRPPLQRETPGSPEPHLKIQAGPVGSVAHRVASIGVAFSPKTQNPKTPKRGKLICHIIAPFFRPHFQNLLDLLAICRRGEVETRSTTSVLELWVGTLLQQVLDIVYFDGRDRFHKRSFTPITSRIYVCLIVNK